MESFSCRQHAKKQSERRKIDGVIRWGAVMEGQSGPAVLHDTVHRASIDNM